MAEQKSPFAEGSAGQNAFKAAYERLKEQSNLSRQGIAQDYAKTYQDLRGQSFAQGLGAAAQRGLSGGQAAGVSQQLGAQQIGALGNLMQGQEKALREQSLADTSRFSNALLEGQQAQQMEREDVGFNLQREEQIQSIVGDKNLSLEQKRRRLAILGINDNQINNLFGLGTAQGLRTSSEFTPREKVRELMNRFNFTEEEAVEFLTQGR
jgi:hypothetical protein